MYTSGHAGFDSPPHVKVKGTAVKKQMEINKWPKILKLTTFKERYVKLSTLNTAHNKLKRIGSLFFNVILQLNIKNFRYFSLN